MNLIQLNQKVKGILKNVPHDQFVVYNQVWSSKSIEGEYYDRYSFYLCVYGLGRKGRDISFDEGTIQELLEALKSKLVPPVEENPMELVEHDKVSVGGDLPF